METTKKRTREEVRAAFRAFMREKEEERKAAEIRLELYHKKRLAGLIQNCPPLNLSDYDTLNLENINKQAPYKVTVDTDFPHLFYFHTDYEVDYEICIKSNDTFVPSGAYALDIRNKWQLDFTSTDSNPHSFPAPAFVEWQSD